MNHKDRSKWRIAQEAARLMAEEGIHDCVAAKHKAAVKLGMNPTQGLPRNEDVETALQEHHRLYRAHIQPQHIARLRQLALEAMRFFRQFSPQLVGGVLDGSAGAFSPVTLCLFPETPEEVIHSLMDGHIPFVEISVNLRNGGNGYEEFPGIEFFVDGVRMELCLLPSVFRQQAASRWDKTLPRGVIEDVEALVQASPKLDSAQDGSEGRLLEGMK